MGFDAGKITAHLDLSTDEFNQKADEVEKKKEDLAKDVSTKVGADDRDFKATADEVEVKKEELGKKVTVPVELDGRPAIEEAKATDAAIKRELPDPTLTPKVDGAKAIAEAEFTGRAARSAMSDAFLGAGDKGPLLSSLFGSGANTPQLLADSLQSLGWGPNDAKALVNKIDKELFGALPQGASAQSLINAILPSPGAFSRALSDGIYSLTTGEATQIAKAYQIAGGEKTSFQRDPSIARNLFGDQASITQRAMGNSMVPFDFIDASAKWSSTDSSSSSADSGGGFFKSLSAKTAGSFLTGISDAFSQATRLLSGGGSGGGGGFFSGVAQSVSGGASSLSQSISGIAPAAQGIALAAPIVPALLGAVGIAAGGALAGTAIGGAGFLGALLPGLLDLKQGYGVYQAQQAFNAAGGYTGPNAAQNVSTLQQATAGANPGNYAVASSLGNLLNGGNGFLAGLEQKVNPEILKFLDALTKMLPIIAPFFESAVNSLTKFFDSVDRGMTSQGFKDFMKAMTKDVGPIMDEFGKAISNVAGAVGGFLKLFGGPAAQAVGAWIDRVTGGLDHWLNNASIGPGAIDAMTKAFNFLGAAGDLIWTVFKKVWDALTPIGAVLITVLTPALQGITWALNAIPTGVLTGFAAGFGALLLLSNPIGQFAAAIIVLGLALKGLQGIMAANFKPMNAADWKNAFAGELGGKTPADLAALQHAKDLGLTPQDVYHGYNFIAPKPPGPGGSGFTSPADNSKPVVPAGYGKGTNPDPGGVFSKQNIQRFLTDLKDLGPNITKALAASDGAIKNWRHNIAATFDQANTDIANFVTKSVPHALSTLGGFFTSAFDKVTHALDTARHDIAHYFDVVTTSIANFVTKSVPNAFSGLGGFFKRDFDNATHAIDTARHDIASAFDSVVTGISNFVTKSVPNAFSGLKDAVLGAFSGAGSWLLGVGAQIINGFISGIDNAIHKVNGLTSGIPLIGGSLHIPDVPHFADGGPVLGPQGAPQLAVVHGGEYVLSQAMLSRGVAGGTTVNITVDARGSSDPSAVTAAAKTGVTATLPQLRRAFIGSRAA